MLSSPRIACSIRFVYIAYVVHTVHIAQIAFGILCGCSCNQVMCPAVGVGDYQAAVINQYLPQLAELPVGNAHVAENMVLRQLPLSQFPDSVQ